MTYLYIDHYGDRFYAKTVKELRAQIGGGGCKVSKMYVDSKDGKKSWHIGYVIGTHWLTKYAPVEVEITK